MQGCHATVKARYSDSICAICQVNWCRARGGRWHNDVDVWIPIARRAVATHNGSITLVLFSLTLIDWVSNSYHFHLRRTTCSRVFLMKLTALQLVKQFFALYGTPSFIPPFAKHCQWTLLCKEANTISTWDQFQCCPTNNKYASPEVPKFFRQMFYVLFIAHISATTQCILQPWQWLLRTVIWPRTGEPTNGDTIYCRGKKFLSYSKCPYRLCSPSSPTSNPMRGFSPGAKTAGSWKWPPTSV